MQAQQQAPMQPMQARAGAGMQAPAAAQAPAPTAAPTAPKPPANLSMNNVDTGLVVAEHAPVVRSLTALFKACEAAAGANPARRKEVDDSSKRLAGLLWKLNQADVSASVCGKLLQLCAALDGGDVAAATQVQVVLTTSDWDEGSSWLTALKRLLKMRQALG
jgi:protein transport protein SEC31